MLSLSRPLAPHPLLSTTTCTHPYPLSSVPISHLFPQPPNPSKARRITPPCPQTPFPQHPQPSPTHQKPPARAIPISYPLNPSLTSPPSTPHHKLPLPPTTEHPPPTHRPPCTHTAPSNSNLSGHHRSTKWLFTISLPPFHPFPGP